MRRAVNRSDIDRFTKADICRILDEAHFNEEQLSVFDLLVSTRFMDDISIYMRLNLSQSRYYRIKKIVLEKINRILNE